MKRINDVVRGRAESFGTMNDIQRITDIIHWKSDEHGYLITIDPEAARPSSLSAHIVVGLGVFEGAQNFCRRYFLGRFIVGSQG